MSQRCTATGVTFRKAAFKLLKSLQTNWTSQPPRICLFTWLLTPKKKSTLPTSITGITKTLALWLQQQLTSAYFYTESFPFHGDLHTFTMPSLQPIWRYPVSRLSIAIHCYPLLSRLPRSWGPPQTAPGRSIHPTVDIAITSGVADCTFTPADMGHMAWPLRFSVGAFETRTKREIHHERLKITMGGLPHLHFGGPHLQVPMPDHYKLHPQNPCLGGQLLEGETNPLPRHVWSSSGGKARFTTTCKKGTWSRSHNPKSIPDAIPLRTTLSDHPKTNPFRSPQNPG